MTIKERLFIIIISSWAFFGFSCYYAKPLILTAEYNCEKNEQELEKKNIDLIPQDRSENQDSCKNLASQGFQIHSTRDGGVDNYGYIKVIKKCSVIMFKPNARSEDHTLYKDIHIENFKSISKDLKLKLKEETISTKIFEDEKKMNQWCATHIP